MTVAELLALYPSLTSHLGNEVGLLLLGMLLLLGAMVGTAWRIQTGWSPQPARVRNRLSEVEHLESRQLLDAGMGGELQLIEGESIVINGELHENVDLIALAKAIANTGAVYFGAPWCQSCTNQKEMFGAGGKYLPFVNVVNPDRTLNQIGIDNNISQFPTWVFPDGSREVGVLPFQTLIQRSGVTEIPISTTPHLEDIGTVDIYGGEAFHLPLNGYTPTGQPLTYTVSTENGNAQAEILQQNPSLRITVAGYGTMEFQLFKDLAPTVTNRIMHLANSGFYDGLQFHRIISGFMIQGGDPNGDGTGGSSLPNFDDQYHPDLRHNNFGMLSMAKSFDDTNNSQFFITAGSQRHLDFQHSVFGVMTKGHQVLYEITQIAKVGDPNQGVPQFPVTMTKVEVFQDTTNAVLKLNSAPGVEVSDTVTVTVSDPDGNTFQRTFDINYYPAPANSNPFLNFVPDIVMEQNGSTQFQLSATNVDGVTLHYFDHARLSQVPAATGIPAPPAGLSYSVDANTGLLQVQASQGLTGTFHIVVGVSRSASPQTHQVDYQFIQVTLAEKPVLNDFVRGMDEGTSTTFNPSTNDVAPGEVINHASVRLVSLPEVGHASVNPATGQVTYRPPKGFVGEVTFQYVAANSIGIAGDPATIKVVVSKVNNPPTAYDDVFRVDRNTTTLLNVLQNDDRGSENEANDPVTIMVNGTSQAGGQLLVIDNKVRYIPPTGFVGTDTFTYTLEDDGMTSEATVTVEVQARAAFDLSITQSPSSVDPDGQVAGLPPSTDVIDEWSSFWVEVWASSDSVAQNGVSSAAATLSFDPSMFVIDSYEMGVAFTNQGSSFDNQTGAVTLSGSTSVNGLGHNARVLLGRVLFKPIADGPGMPVPKVGESLGVPADQFLGFESLSLVVNGTTINEPTTGAMPHTRFLPVVYDLNNDGVIDFADVIAFVGNLGTNAPGSGASFLDFNGTGTVNLDDFDRLLRFFGASRGGDVEMVYTPSLVAMVMTDAITATSHHVNLVPPPPESFTQLVTATTQILNSLVTPSEGDLDTIPLTIKFVDLPGGQLARTQGSVIEIDYNAAGHGWYFDADPTTNDAFYFNASTGSYLAYDDGPAAGRIDFTTVLLHELGHLAGHGHSDSGLMSPYLSPGERRFSEEDFDFHALINLIAVDSYFADL